MQNRVFFPQPTVDQWGIDGKIDLSPTELVVVAEGRTYQIVDAVYVIAEVTGANDAHGLVGKVKANATLEPLGAEILENSMIIGDNAYDVVPGWLGTPSTPFAEHLMSKARYRAKRGKTDVGSGPGSDEELLRRCAEGTL